PPSGARSRPLVLQLDGEPWEPFTDGPVEGLLVLRRSLLAEGCRIRITDRREELCAGLDEVEIVAVALLGLLARRRRVRPLRGGTVGDEPGLLALEQCELTRDHIAEAPPEDHRSER